MSDALSSLAPDARALALNEIPETIELPLRDLLVSESAMAVPAIHEDHDHSHGEHDPHSWLDPVNASLWLGVLVSILGEVDPVKAAIYHRNAEAGQRMLEDLIAETQARLSLTATREVTVVHDAYQYFEAGFGVNVSTFSPRHASGWRFKQTV